MEQKQRFINLAQSGRFTVSELSEEFEITRKTGHKWLLRYAGGGMVEDICYHNARRYFGFYENQ